MKFNILIVILAIGFSNIAQCQPQGPDGNMKGPPPFIMDDELLKKASEKNDPAIQDLIKKQIKEKGPEGLNDDSFRKALQKKLDGQAKKADVPASKGNPPLKATDEKTTDCPDCLAKQSQIIERQLVEMKELKIKMQKNLVEERIDELNTKIADLNDQIDEYKYKQCGMPSGDFPKPDMSSDQIVSDQKPPMNKDFDPSKFADHKAPDANTLMIDLPADLEADLRNAKNDWSSTRNQLSSAKRTWRKKCEKEARNRPDVREQSGEDLASMVMPQMNGSGNHSGMSAGIQFGNGYGSIRMSNSYPMLGSSFSNYGSYSNRYTLMSGRSPMSYSPYPYGGYLQGQSSTMPMVYRP